MYLFLEVGFLFEVWCGNAGRAGGVGLWCRCLKIVIIVSCLGSSFERCDSLCRSYVCRRCHIQLCMVALSSLVVRVN